MDVLRNILNVVSIIFSAFAVYLVAKYLFWMTRFIFRMRPRRPRETGFEYVVVDDGKRVYELDEDEREYLTTEFLPNDSGQPYIKHAWEEIPEDSRFRGFILRRRVPAGIEILPSTRRDRTIIKTP